MYAVIRTGGKQYRVAKDDVIVVEKLTGEPGAAVELDQVLMLDDGDAIMVGAPLIDGARVAATVLDQGRAGKIIVFKKRRRKNYRRTRGHRQDVTVLRITDIRAAGGKEAARAAAPVEAAAEPEAAAKPKAAAEPKAAAKRKAGAKPKPAAKPRSSAKAGAKPRSSAKAGAKPKTAAKPKAARKPKEKS